jgi:inorganic pyrophosphatase
MPKLTRLDHALNEKTRVCRVVVETSKGCRTKFDYDPKTRMFTAHKLLPEGMSFPLDFGFVPSTLCDDGDPLDVMIIADEPNPTGTLIEVRLIGVLQVEEREHGKRERNDRLLGVSTLSHLYVEVQTADDLPKGFIDNLGDFWKHKALLEDKTLEIIGVAGPAVAVEAVERASRTAK